MTLEILQTSILTNKAKRIRRNGREYAVANGVILAPRVLAGSQGPLYYPAEQIKNSAPDWDQIPITLAHPKKDGRDASAFEEGILKNSGIGWLEKPAVNTKDKLAVEYWFDVQKTLKVAPQIIDNLDEGIEMEVSTGLFTENEPATNGAAFEGTPYSHIAKNYKPDHLAILLDAKGACSVRDGCGVLVNKANRPKIDIAKAIAEGAEDDDVESYSEDREESDESFGRTLAANRQVIANAYQCYCHTKSKRQAVLVNANPEGCNQYKSCSGEFGAFSGASKQDRNRYRWLHPITRDIVDSAIKRAGSKKKAKVAVEETLKKMSIENAHRWHWERASQFLSELTGNILSNYTGSHDELRNKLQEKLRNKYPMSSSNGSAMVGETPWIQDVFDGYVVYMKDGKSWKLNYSETKDGDCKFEGNPVQVVRSTSYVSVKNAFCPTGKGGGQKNDCSSKGAGAGNNPLSDDELANALTNSPTPTGKKFSSRDSFSISPTALKKGDTINHAGDFYKVVRSGVKRKKDSGYNIQVEGKDRPGIVKTGSTVSVPLLRTSNASLPSRQANVSSAKACKILHDKSANGLPLNEAQRGVFRAICSKRKKTNNQNINWNPVSTI